MIGYHSYHKGCGISSFNRESGCWLYDRDGIVAVVMNPGDDYDSREMNKQFKNHGISGDPRSPVETHCMEALERIAALDKITEIRGHLEDVFVPEHLVKEGGWVPVHPRIKAGLDYAAGIAKQALSGMPHKTTPSGDTGR